MFFWDVLKASSKRFLEIVIEKVRLLRLTSRKKKEPMSKSMAIMGQSLSAQRKYSVCAREEPNAIEEELKWLIQWRRGTLQLTSQLAESCRKSSSTSLFRLLMRVIYDLCILSYTYLWNNQRIVKEREQSLMICRQRWEIEWWGITRTSKLADNETEFVWNWHPMEWMKKQSWIWSRRMLKR